jgi:hypothetical protein
MRKLVLLLVLVAFQNPGSVYCDYHSAYATYYGNEYPNGVCYAVYKHDYYDASCHCYVTHKLAQKCR